MVTVMAKDSFLAICHDLMDWKPGGRNGEKRKAEGSEKGRRGD
jgi:hypothetical protein